MNQIHSGIITACYLRYSSENQRESSIEDQLRNIENYCRANGLPRPVVFKDQALTGARDDRPGYLEMQRAAYEKQFHILLLNDQTRLSRHTVESLKVLETLKYHDVDTVCVTDGLDTRRSGWKILAGMGAIMGEAYLDSLSSNVKRGLEGRVLAGYCAGRAPYGYDLVDDGKGKKRVINEAQAEIVRLIYKRFAEGASTRVITKELNDAGYPGPSGGLWRHSTMDPNKGKDRFGILANPLYIGKLTWRRTKRVKEPATNDYIQVSRSEDEYISLDLPELRIVSDELWEKVQQRNARAKAKGQTRHGSGRPSTNVYNGILRCGVCGDKYVLKSVNYFGCKNTADRLNATCTNRVNIKGEVLDEKLLTPIKEMMLTEEAFALFEATMKDLMKREAPDHKPLNARLAKAEKTVQNLMNAIMAGVLTPTTKTALEQAELEVKAAKAQLSTAEAFSPEQVVPMARKVYDEMVAHLTDLDNPYLARQALQNLLGTVTLTPKADGTKELIAETSHSTLSSVFSEMLQFPREWGHFIKANPLRFQVR